MLEGYTSVPIEHFGGLVCAWPPEMLDESLLVEATNLRFTLAEVCSREGLTRAFASPHAAPIAGLLDYVQVSGAETPLVYDAAGNFFFESPAGSGRLVPVTSGQLTPPPGAWMNGVAAFNRAYLAFGDGQTGTGAPATFDGANLDPLTIAAPGGTIVPADAATAGNVAAGVRYVTVLYRTRAGSLSPIGTNIANWAAAGGLQATISNLPLGPANCTSRVVAFTVAGGSSAGPYFYIGESATVNGISETTTVVDDNTSTTATFNFDDAFLASSNDATDQFRAIVLPPQLGVTFSETTQRLFWWGDPSQPSVVQCSQPNDGGNYFGDTGFFQVGINNGQRVTAVFEYRNQIYAVKQDSLYLVTPNDGDPATWSLQMVAPFTGVAGPRAAAVGDGMAVIVHRTGAYIFDGGTPTWISDELIGPSPDRPGVWERINWAYDHLIWVQIDNELKAVRIGVPLDGATTCSHILKACYLDGWERDIRFSPFTGRYHFFPGRRWSLDTIAASQAVRVKRPVALPGIPADRRLGQSQILLASALSDGSVSYPDSGSMLDNGAPINWALRTGAISAADIVKQQRQGMEMLGMVEVRARGQGSVVVECVADGDDPVPLMTLELSDTERGDARGLALINGENIALRLSSGGNPAALRLEAIYAFAKPSWLLRPGL